MAGFTLSFTLLLALRLLHAQTTSQWSRGLDSSDGGGLQTPRQQSNGVQTSGSQNPGFDTSDFPLSDNGVNKGVSMDYTFKHAHLNVQPGNLTCYSCKLDFRKAPYEWAHPCLGRHNGLNVSSDYLVVCGPNDLFCRAERTEVNGILITLTRECTDVCYFGCRPKGFGIGYESCAKCCTQHACNHMYPLSGAATTILSLNTVFLGWFLIAFTHCP